MSRAHKTGRIVVAFAIVAITAMSCGSADRAATRSPTATGRVTPTSVPQSTAEAAPSTVWMGDHYFSPSRLTVKVGTTVTWRMLGSQEHDVWSLDGSFHSPTMGPGSKYTHTFNTPGIFKYICLPHHGDGMYGEIAVLL